MLSLYPLPRFQAPGFALRATAHLLLFAAFRSASIFNLGPQHLAAGFQLLTNLF